VEEIPTCSLGRTPHHSRWMPKGGSGPDGSTRWSKFLAGPVDPWREMSPHGSRFAGRTYTPLGNTHWSSLFLKDVKDCSPWEGLILEKFVEGCLLCEGPHNGAEEECEESSP